MKTSRYC